MRKGDPGGGESRSSSCSRGVEVMKKEEDT
jgi:hypothetical protein